MRSSAFDPSEGGGMGRCAIHRRLAARVDQASFARPFPWGSIEVRLEFFYPCLPEPTPGDTGHRAPGPCLGHGVLQGYHRGRLGAPCPAWQSQETTETAKGPEHVRWHGVRTNMNLPNLTAASARDLTVN